MKGQEKLAAMQAEFEFLKSEFGYRLMATNDACGAAEDKENYVVIYYNEIAEKQIEIASKRTSPQYLGLWVRRVIDGIAVPYNDCANLISIGDLALLHDPEDYDRDAISFYKCERSVVINNITAILTHFKDSLTTTQWFDKKKLFETERGHILNKFHFDISRNCESAPERAKRKTSFLMEDGYELLGYSELLPPYQRSIWYVTYSNEKNTITIRQVDWRDDCHLMRVVINDDEIAELPIADLYKDNFSSYLKYLIKEAL